MIGVVVEEMRVDKGEKVVVVDDGNARGNKVSKSWGNEMRKNSVIRKEKVREVIKREERKSERR